MQNSQHKTEVAERRNTQFRKRVPAHRYVYNQSRCGRCGSKISTWEMAARKVYACQTCQPLQVGTEISPARAQALRGGIPTKVMQREYSHSSPDAVSRVINDCVMLPYDCVLRMIVVGTS